jgi:DNA replication licensing factor MCM7
LIIVKTRSAYISKARSYKPIVPPELMGQIVSSYVELREKHNSATQLFCTPRTLLSILRLSQAAV